MVTQFNETFDLTKEFNCYTVGVQKVEDIHKKCYVYIPTIMPNIKKGKGRVISNLKIKGYSVFKNHSSCRPKLSGSVIKEQNYITGKMENNSSVDNISNGYNGIDHNIKLRCKFSNSKLSKLSINTD